MASNPPFQVEDQTDEEFFNKLVDDDFGNQESHTGLQHGTDSYEDKAFANSSIGNVGTVAEGSGAVQSSTEGEGHSDDVLEPSSDAPEKDLPAAEEGTSLVSSNSMALENPTELSDPVTAITKVGLDSTPANSSGSRSVSIKEVQWSAFNTNSSQQEARNSGSFSDFFTELGDNSVDPFADVCDKSKADSNSKNSFVGNPVADSMTSFSSSEHQLDQSCGTVSEQTEGQDLYSSQYWETLYPGWRYDPVSGQWYHVDGYNSVETAQVGSQDKGQWAGADVLEQRSEVSYLQQTAQSIVGTVIEDCTTRSVSNWNQASQGSTEFPDNMIFDRQYPGWYYDMIAQEWRTLESYTQAVQMNTGNEQKTQEGNASMSGFSDKGRSLYGEFDPIEHYKSEEQSRRSTGSGNNYTQSSTLQSEPVAKSAAAMVFAKNHQTENLYGSVRHVNNFADQQMSFKEREFVSTYGHASQSYDSQPRSENGFQNLAATKNFYQYNQYKVEQNQRTHVASDYYGNQQSVNYAQLAHASHTNLSYVQSEARSSVGRPPHALVTFGFGGKLIVMKSISSSYGTEDPVGGLVSILNLAEVVADKTHVANLETSACDYFLALCQQSFPGPLVGGSAATKDLNKWIDERIANCQSPYTDFRKGEILKLLLSLLKIYCQHYGKLRTPFGLDSALQETDGHELAVAKLFASAGRNGSQLNKYGAVTHCVQNVPTEEQIRTTAVKVQNLLVSGRRKEALQCAQEGQLWGPAIVLAAQLGGEFYFDTVKLMAHRQLVWGSPLRTLCLLIAMKPADVFSGDNSSNASPLTTIKLCQQPTQFVANAMLDNWEENLAIITANRTKDDGLVILHLGDCLWRERGEIAAAHICYLVAEANLEPYSNSARLCLIGADHMKCPRTYASPEAIQRTELYEYSKVLGNSQFTLLPFQPYKVAYAHMLAEVGKISHSLRYCQAILKTLKNVGRAPEVETWKSMLSSLEERIKTHQQGGYNANLAPAKLVGKLFTSIDRSIHRMIGGPPPGQSTSQSSAQGSEHDNHSTAPKVANSQSTMAVSSLMPSASMETISELTNDSNRMTMHYRSISEPDFGRTPKQDQVSPTKQATTTGGKASLAGGPSRFGRIGSQLLQKTMGWVSRSRPDRQVISCFNMLLL